MRAAAGFRGTGELVEIEKIYYTFRVCGGLVVCVPHEMVIYWKEKVWYLM